MDRIDLRLGRILEATVFARARRPAYKLRIDFGPALGIRQSSAQLTFGYPDPAMLVGQPVLAVINFAPRNVAGFMSQVLVTGFYADESKVILMQPSEDVLPLGTRIIADKNMVEGESAIISFDTFLESHIVIGEYTGKADGQLSVDCGSEHGLRRCPDIEKDLILGQRVVVLLLEGDQGKAIGADTETGFIPLTSDECVPLGCRLA